MDYDTVDEAKEAAIKRWKLSASNKRNRHFCVYIFDDVEIRVCQHTSVPLNSDRHRVVWSTRSLVNFAEGAGRPRALTGEQERQMLEHRKAGATFECLGLMFGVSHTSAMRMCRRAK
ncbi:MAG: hypothetical protein [Edwardsiella phage MSW-3]|nr:MAG: hypothetical protein [Edwardsiella phage MSW-3]